jgi:hypothetical protein
MTGIFFPGLTGLRMTVYNFIPSRIGIITLVFLYEVMLSVCAVVWPESQTEKITTKNIFLMMMEIELKIIKIDKAG